MLSLVGGKLFNFITYGAAISVVAAIFGGLPYFERKGSRIAALVAAVLVIISMGVFEQKNQTRSAEESLAEGRRLSFELEKANGALSELRLASDAGASENSALRFRLDNSNKLLKDLQLSAKSEELTNERLASELQKANVKISNLTRAATTASAQARSLEVKLNEANASLLHAQKLAGVQASKVDRLMRQNQSLSVELVNTRVELAEALENGLADTRRQIQEEGQATRQEAASAASARRRNKERNAVCAASPSLLHVDGGNCCNGRWIQNGIICATHSR